LNENSNIPMRWIKGDTAPHFDVGASDFNTTYLLYLNDSPGELVIDNQSYPIEANTGFSFHEGVSHKTQHTENIPRLLVGPMNELIEPVGNPIAITYYLSQSDAENNSNPIGSSSSSYIVGNDLPSEVPFTSWRIASNSNGLSSQTLVYQNGNELDDLKNIGGLASYYLYPSLPCFLEGTTMLCQIEGVEKYVPIEKIKKDMLVKTSLNGFKPVVLIGKGTIHNPETNERIENRLYKCSTNKYPELKEDLYITGCHSILESNITEKQKEDTIKHLGKLFVTDKKYRLMACLDERAEPWSAKGDYSIWHVALDNKDEKMNYGVYVNGGLLVETCSIYFLKHSNLLQF